jgi:hypothetical protein
MDFLDSCTALEEGRRSSLPVDDRSCVPKRRWSTATVIKEKLENNTQYLQLFTPADDLLFAALLYPTGNSYIFNYQPSLNMDEQEAEKTASYALLIKSNSFSLRSRTSCYYCDQILGKYSCGGDAHSAYRETLMRCTHEMRAINGTAQLNGIAPIRARHVEISLPTYLTAYDMYDPWCERTSAIRKNTSASSRFKMDQLIEKLSVEETTYFSTASLKNWGSDGVSCSRSSSCSTSPSRSSTSSFASSPNRNHGFSFSGDDSSAPNSSNASSNTSKNNSSDEDTLSETSEGTESEYLDISRRRASLQLTQQLSKVVPPHTLISKLPKWEKTIGSLVLQFPRNNRVTCSSTKNLLILDETTTEAILQFGKTTSGVFNLDWRGMGTIQAFSIALSAFQWRTQDR